MIKEIINKKGIEEHILNRHHKLIDIGHGFILGLSKKFLTHDAIIYHFKLSKYYMLLYDKKPNIWWGDFDVYGEHFSVSLKEELKKEIKYYIDNKINLIISSILYHQIDEIDEIEVMKIILEHKKEHG